MNKIYIIYSAAQERCDIVSNRMSNAFAEGFLTWNYDITYEILPDNSVEYVNPSNKL